MKSLFAGFVPLGLLGSLAAADVVRPHVANDAAGALSKWLEVRKGYGNESTLLSMRHNLGAPLARNTIINYKRQNETTSMCGIGSKGGSVSCGLDLCCSSGGWCGSSEAHCIGSEGSKCQEGFGKCEMVQPKSCGEDSGTSQKRMIGYYQANNVHNRACNRIYPQDIKTDEFTHLYWAFASINPETFVLEAWDAADEQQMKDFTALKGKGRDLQPWVAVGGYDFSNIDTPTHTTWSDLCADATRRASFIESAAIFMDKYGFMGIDLDWEFPVAPERGGTDADVANLVLLLKEMRAAWGPQYGISIAVPADYWSLRQFDLKGLEPFVDHIGFMSYDLRGSFDSNGNSLDPVVLGQADLREIEEKTIPLAYAEIDPEKIVLGMAFYGRGYTLADPACNTFNCQYKGPSNPGKCTNSAGVLSLMEIKEMIKNGEATSRLNKEAAMKELIWDDQWVAYDDAETIELKKLFANDRCYGGVMAWSVDYNAGEEDPQGPPVTTDGTCGPQNGGTVCEGSIYGDCCSLSGWCGSSEAYCGTDCVSGKCTEGGVSSNGRCGAGFRGAICEGSVFGDCCSAGGWCGSTPDHCGAGCQNGLCS